MKTRTKKTLRTGAAKAGRPPAVRDAEGRALLWWATALAAVSGLLRTGHRLLAEQAGGSADAPAAGGLDRAAITDSITLLTTAYEELLVAGPRLELLPDLFKDIPLT